MAASIRNVLRERAGRRCEYCGIPDHAYSLPFHVEHIVAKVHRRDSSLANLAWACPRCNWQKGTNLSTIDPLSGQRVDLYDPRVDSWDEHFAMRHFQIIGLSGIGRGTVHLLRMNSIEQIALRELAMGDY